MRTSLRLLSLLAVLPALFLAPGCGRQADPAAPRRPVVGVSVPSATHGWTAGVGHWAQQAMAQYPEIEWRFQRAAGGDQQVAHIEAMLAAGIDALVFLPEDAGTVLRAIREAKRQGVYVVSVDRGLEEDIADLYLAGDNRAFGRIAAEFMVEKLGGEGRIVILRGKSVPIDTERYEAAMEVFRQHPGITVVATQRGEWNAAISQEVMDTVLAAHDRIDAVWASDDDMALGVERALRARGRADELWVLGGAGMKDVVRRVADGDPLFPANVTYPPSMTATAIHLAAAEVLYDGDETRVADRIPPHAPVDRDLLLSSRDQRPAGQRELRIDIHLITPDNAEAFYFPDSPF